VNPPAEGVLFGRRSPLNRGPFSMPNHRLSCSSSWAPSLMLGCPAHRRRRQQRNFSRPWSERRPSRTSRHPGHVPESGLSFSHWPAGLGRSHEVRCSTSCRQSGVQVGDIVMQFASGRLREAEVSIAKFNEVEGSRLHGHHPALVRMPDQQIFTDGAARISDRPPLRVVAQLLGEDFYSLECCSHCSA
jgi:hypothetical protein